MIVATVFLPRLKPGVSRSFFVNTMEDFNRAYFRQFGVWIEERYRELMEGYWDIVYQKAQESKARYELSQAKRTAKSTS